MAKLEPRAPAPPFTLKDLQGQDRGLQEFAGKKTVLVFYRGSGCLHCARQLRAFAAIESRLRTAGITLIGISSDSLEDLRAASAAIKSGAIPFLLLADGDRKVFREYGCYSEAPLHGTFVIGSDGRVAWASEIGDEPEMDIERVLSEAENCDLPN